MFRSKFLLKGFAILNKITSKRRLAPSIFISDITPNSCLSTQKLLLHARKDINGFKKLKCIDKLQLLKISEKYYSKYTDAKCWNCEKYLEIKNFACVACGALQHPKKRLSHFELFGFSQTFDINVEELSKKFKKLQTTFHPDKYASKTKAEKEISENYSRLVNKAYSTLKDPLQRGSYLLALQKYPECNTPLDPEFLKGVMSKNEELECLSSENAIEKFRIGLIEETEKYLALVTQAFKSGNLHEAKINLTKLNYFTSINNRAKEKIDLLQEKRSS